MVKAAKEQGISLAEVQRRAFDIFLYNNGTDCISNEYREEQSA